MRISHFSTISFLTHTCFHVIMIPILAFSRSSVNRMWILLLLVEGVIGLKFLEVQFFPSGELLVIHIGERCIVGRSKGGGLMIKYLC